jgi:hypothetical protein
MTDRKQMTKDRRGSAIAPTAPAKRTPAAPTPSAHVSSLNTDASGKKARRSASITHSSLFESQRETNDDASIYTDVPIDDIRSELDHLHATVEQLHRTLYEQRIIIDLQNKEINSLKESHNAHVEKLNKLDEELNLPPEPLPPQAPNSYKDILKTGLPDIANTIIKEQHERKRREKSLIIKDKGNIIVKSQNAVEDVRPFLTSLGATPEDLNGIAVRIVINRPLTSNNPAPIATGKSIILTLPTIGDRHTLISKLRQSLRKSMPSSSLYIDPDLTPSEAKDQYDLRLERNKLNQSRNNKDKETFYYGIRRDKVVKIII